MSQTVGSLKPASAARRDKVLVSTNAVIAVRIDTAIGTGCATSAMMVATKKANKCRWLAPSLARNEIKESPGNKHCAPTP